MTGPNQSESRRRFGLDRPWIWDVACIGLGLLAVGGLYLRTMYPGISATGDATKFAFVGPVLGTPHAPGYPLYMVVSYLFSLIPIGTLAYRMNLLSVCFALTALAGVYGIARVLGASRIASLIAMIAVGTGDTFWSRALYAKGYTLNATLVAAGTLLLLRWGQTQRQTLLVAAVAVFALSLGNHLIVIALVPALVGYVLILAGREAFRPRTILMVVGLVAAGLSQYFYILIRSLQGAPYLEARATTLAELWGVMTARRFSHEIVAFDWSTLISERLPAIGQLALSDLTIPGLLLVVFGALTLARRRAADVSLVMVGAAGVLLLTANMASDEDQGFILPALVLLWPLVAVGISALTAGAARRSPALGVMVLASAFLVPGLAVVRNFDRNDNRNETGAIAFMDQLFEKLPDRSALVGDEYRLRQMLLYKLLGENAAGDRDIKIISSQPADVRAAMADGWTVVAFGESAGLLRSAGFEMETYLPTSAPSRDGFRIESLRVIRTSVCVAIGGVGWVAVQDDVRPAGRVMLRVDNFSPFESEVLWWVWGREPLDPLVVQTAGAGTVETRLESFPPGSDAAGAVRAKWLADGVVKAADPQDPRWIHRLRLVVNDKGAYQELAVDLGRSVDEVMLRATADRPPPERIRVCAHPLGSAENDRRELDVTMASSAVQFGDGWYAVERRADGFVSRWTAAVSTVFVAMPAPESRTVRLTVEPFRYPGSSASTLTVAVNGRDIGSHVLPADRSDVVFVAPAAAWRDGLNTIDLRIRGAAAPADVGLGDDRRILGVSASRLRITPVR